MTEDTTLNDFTDSTSNEMTNSSTNKQGNATESSQKSPEEEEASSTDNNHDTTQNTGPGRDNPTSCPVRQNELENCVEELGEETVNKLGINKIGCGHAIDYIRQEYDVSLAHSSANNYSSNLRIFVEFLHSRNKTVSESSLSDLKDFIRAQVKQNKKKKTISGYRSVITNLYKHIDIHREVEVNFNWANIREVININDYNVPSRREREPLSKEEVKELYDAMNSFRDRLMVQVCVELGPRNIDTCQLTINDIDLDNNEIELTNTKSNRKYTLPISDELALLLRRWVEQERPAHSGATENEYLFPSAKGGSLTGNAFRKIVKEAAERAGIQEREESKRRMSEREREILNTSKEYKEFHKVTPHTLRHTFNHLLDQAGIPREARSKALDHENEKVTKDFYDHKESNYQELMEELFSDSDSLLDK